MIRADNFFDTGLFKKLPPLAICVSAVMVIILLSSLLFSRTPLYDPDSYYNISVAGSIKEHGLKHDFKWAKFSIFNTKFADKDLLLHIASLPFLYITEDPVAAAKYTIILCAAFFLAVYAFLIRRYLPSGLTALFIVLPFISSVFLTYSLELRSMMLVNIILPAGIYCILSKRTVPLFFVSALYALAHVSFFLIIFFAFILETVRRSMGMGFYTKNVLAAIAGCVIGCAIHPNFPNNILFVYLNGMIAPLIAINGAGFGSSGETMAAGASFVIINNFAVLFFIAAIPLLVPVSRKRISLDTMGWMVITLIFMIAALHSLRYWYHATPLFFLFLASYLKDAGPISRKRYTALIISFAIAAMIFMPGNIKQFSLFRDLLTSRSAHYEDAGKWMAKHIPSGQTIYHSYWEDSSYFICFNPGDYYINTNDPVYMLYSNPDELKALDDLSMGRVSDPAFVIKNRFGARFAYVRKDEPLYRQILLKQEDISILFEDGQGLILEING